MAIPESCADGFHPDPPAARVDAHHHLWSYDPAQFPWIGDAMATLRRDFLPADLEPARAAMKIDFTIAVQARQSLDENTFLLRCAEAQPTMLGVVGWVPLTSPDLPRMLQNLSHQSRVVGMREIAQGQPEGFFEQPEFNRGIAELTRRNLTYDILIYQHQLAEATQFVDRHPNQAFILDHAAKPLIRNCELERWATLLRELGRRPNVYCKLSGLVTEADWHSWTEELLTPYLDVCVSAFGPHRLLAGSDWPVCLVASSYERWWRALERYFRSFSLDEQRAVFGRNAVRAYHLSLPGQTR